jgi:hypothetical protein
VKKFCSLTVLMLSSVLAFEQGKTETKQIAEALLPLPEPLRDGATVVLDAVPGKRKVLRKGTNGIICRANTSPNSFSVYCYPQELDAYRTRFEQLALEGKTSSEIRDILSAEAASGKLKCSVGATEYTMSGDSAESSLPLTVIFLPHATSESTGLSTERDHYRPWLMWAGTPWAHVMIPGK